MEVQSHQWLNQHEEVRYIFNKSFLFIKFYQQLHEDIEEQKQLLGQYLN